MKTFITKLTESVTIKLPKLGSLVMKMPFDKGKHTIDVYLLSTTPFKVEGIGNTQVKIVSDTNYSETINLPAASLGVENEKCKVTVFNPNSDYGEFQIINFDGNLFLAGTDNWGHGNHVIVDNPILLKLSNTKYAMDANIDLSSFKGNSTIQYLLCDNTHIHGDISSLANCTELKELNLSKTQVSGDISSLANCIKLTSLGISNTQVSGDISSLANCTGLINLSIFNTQVSGDISSLANCTELASLGISNTQVSGDITNIVTNLTKLKALMIPPTVTITDAQKKTLTDRGCGIYIA